MQDATQRACRHMHAYSCLFNGKYASEILVQSTIYISRDIYMYLVDTIYVTFSIVYKVLYSVLCTRYCIQYCVRCTVFSIVYKVYSFTAELYQEMLVLLWLFYLNSCRIILFQSYKLAVHCKLYSCWLFVHFRDVIASRLMISQIIKQGCPFLPWGGWTIIGPQLRI